MFTGALIDKKTLVTFNVTLLTKYCLQFTFMAPMQSGVLQGEVICLYR